MVSGLYSIHCKLQDLEEKSRDSQRHDDFLQPGEEQKLPNEVYNELLLSMHGMLWRLHPQRLTYPPKPAR